AAPVTPVLMAALTVVPVTAAPRVVRERPC
ncbi:MAG: hypothetical protein QOJ78_2823, partial [Pseudonocardiales bacterium]|nr:hypothetical protein [Pseudonocardiales bacterium]